ncbi:MAG: 2-oxo acid dehydrogenase subunit E2 [Candidatus Riflebacteria bacterium]|nr:2-oxo acid dehydrogenase subunit E2 [Candidatus Riflebacteria bacterium]
MSFEYKELGPDRYLVWDLLRESDPYYLNQHIFDIDFTELEQNRELHRKDGKPAPSYVAYCLYAYSRVLNEFPLLNSYLRLYPLTKLALYKGVDISLTIEREWLGKRIVLLALLKDAQNMKIEEIDAFLKSRKNDSLESLDEFSRYKSLLKIPAFLRWRLFQIFVKPFPGFLRQLVGTTAFTSIGKFGTDFTTPISPRTITLSLGRVCERPRSVDGVVVSRLSAWLTLTYDHRVIDGADTARAGERIRNMLENWS